MNYPHLPTAVLRNIVANYDRNAYRPGSPFWAKEAEVRAELAEREACERDALGDVEPPQAPPDIDAVTDGK